MKRNLPNFSLSFFTALLLALFVSLPETARAYSVLSHEEVVDMAWKQEIVPMLKSRFPGISDDDIRIAHAYAYGGSVIQDIGYYPFGSHYFSDLLHYVRPGDFVNALIRDSSTPNEYAFALGALAHFCGDTIGHPYVNQVTAYENPRLFRRYGKSVTYAEDPTAHLRTEFGFDVVEVAHGHYSQENYRDFIGFQVSKPLLERAVFETYGIPVSDIITRENLAISTYRRAVSSLIPQMTRVAYVNYKNQIQGAAPGVTKDKFIYRLDQTEYSKSFGTDYTRVGFRGRILAFILRIVPKVGPFRALKLHIPNPEEQDLYLKSVNSVVDQYKIYLAQIHAKPMALPPPDPKDATDARAASDKLAKDVSKYNKLADHAKDPADKAKKVQVAANVEDTAAKADAAAARTEARVAAAQLASPDPASHSALPSPIGSTAISVRPPSTPILPKLDLDTGKPARAGEYLLADETYARLLNELTRTVSNHPASKQPGSLSSSFTTSASRVPSTSNAPHSSTALGPTSSVPSRPIEPALAKDIKQFFAHPLSPVGLPLTHKQAERHTALERQITVDLATFDTLQANPKN